MYLRDGHVWRVSDDPFDTDIYRPLVAPRVQMSPPAAREALPVPPQEPVR
jgi:hypothetical protein